MLASNSRSVPNGTSPAEQVHLAGERAVAGIELARLVELAVVGQVGLGHDAEDPAAGDDDGAVEEPVVDPQRQADDGDDAVLPGRLGDGRERRLAAVEQGALVEQVVAGVGRQAQLGKGDDDGALPGRLLEHGDRLGGVERGSATRTRGTATATRTKPWAKGFRKASDGTAAPGATSCPALAGPASRRRRSGRSRRSRAGGRRPSGRSSLSRPLRRFRLTRAAQPAEAARCCRRRGRYSQPIQPA